MTYLLIEVCKGFDGELSIVVYLDVVEFGLSYMHVSGSFPPRGEVLLEGGRFSPLDHTLHPSPHRVVLGLQEVLCVIHRFPLFISVTLLTDPHEDVRTLRV